VVGGRGVRHTGPAGEVTQADGDGAFGGDDLHGGVDDGASEIAVVVTALTGHVDKSSGPSGGCPGARPSTTAERPDRVMTVRKRFRDGPRYSFARIGYVPGHEGLPGRRSTGGRAGGGVAGAGAGTRGAGARSCGGGQTRRIARDVATVGRTPADRVVSVACGGGGCVGRGADRKSTRLNSSHVKISYAVF